MSSTLTRALLLGLVLVLLNSLLLLPARQNLSQQRIALQAEASSLAEQREGNEASRRLDQRMRLLADVASERGLGEPLGIARLRDRLVEAEGGLALERMSLDFRPDDDVGKGLQGVLVAGSFVSDYPTLRGYLGRTEALKLPLIVDELSFRTDASGRASMSIRWRSRWPETSPPDVQRWMPGPTVFAALTDWLEYEVPGAPGRDPFVSQSFHAASADIVLVDEVPTAESATPAADLHEPDEAIGSSSPLAATLVGFVLARPELEQNVGRRILAAMRFEGQMALVGTGDRLGGFLVERVDARDSITLRNEESGETIVLRLE